MLGILEFTLKSSFEAVLLIVALLLYLTLTGQKNKSKSIWIGTALALGLATLLVYGVDFFGNRELFEFVWLCAILPVLILMVVSVRLARESKVLFWVTSLLVMLAATLLLTATGIELVKFPAKIFVQARTFLSTELILKMIGALAGILLAALFGWTYFKSTTRMNRKLVAGTALITVLVVLARHLITILQLGMALGYIPVTPFLVSITAPIINTYYPLFFYSLVLLVGIQVALARFGTKVPNLVKALNPAAKRKELAGYRNQLRWLSTAAVLLLATGILLGAGHYYSNKKVKLTPAVQLNAENGFVSVPVPQVNDNKLHRFSFLTKDYVTVRFIVINKGNGLFGVGLDACDICGVVGYYQRGEDIVCLNCDVVINKVTIGFPGGCNPIPLPNQVENGSIKIKVTDLEKKQKVFKQ
jgi:uncharacterized membrane protein